MKCLCAHRFFFSFSFFIIYNFCDLINVAKRLIAFIIFSIFLCSGGIFPHELNKICFIVVHFGYVCVDWAKNRRLWKGVWKKKYFYPQSLLYCSQVFKWTKGQLTDTQQPRFVTVWNETVSFYLFFGWRYRYNITFLRIIDSRLWRVSRITIYNPEKRDGKKCVWKCFNTCRKRISITKQ